MFKYLIIALLITLAWGMPVEEDSDESEYDEEVFGTTRPPVQPVSCKGHPADGYFRDPLNPHIFHRCSRGKWIAGYYCPGNLVFDEKEQTCDRDPDVPVVKCPKPNGLFAFPGNPHKFIDCQDGIGYAITCPEDLVFSELNQTCVYNDHGLTWPTDATVAPTRVPTTTTPTTTPQPCTSTPSPVTGPTAGPTTGPTAGPTTGPTAKPTVRPTAEPTAGPTARPTAGPTARPTAGPTSGPTSS
ncbi:unnamed protein product [Medioppia subpectinata]|uniref:Chitin-binding type-2 domain-containing protein n=1 Tax=Medioppia subpectinata TaxID=1979941 RepID=A0A7R9LUZ9_9ACAR|nr:unnamed protein product [Medioppia subpectinata]CAG2121286.1 unnamed protein product [Medioppia subpectinata]